MGQKAGYWDVVLLLLEVVHLLVLNSLKIELVEIFSDSDIIFSLFEILNELWVSALVKEFCDWDIIGCLFKELSGCHIVRLY